MTVIGAAVLGLGLAVPAVATAAPAVLVVGTAGPACVAPTYPTVPAAVAAAAPGATIVVCPGVYPDRVVVDKSLTFLGAQRGKDARNGRTDPAAESVIDAPLGAFVVGAGVSGVTIDGFTLRNSSPPTARANAVDAFQGGSGYTIVNNVITQASYGVNISSDGTTPSTIAHNRFVDDNRATGTGGSGVFVNSGPGNALTISDNLFTGHAGDTGAAINTAGDPARPSTGLRIERNQSIDDSTFAVVVNATGAVVANNQIVRTPGSAAAPGSAILVGGGTSGVQVTSNQISGGAAAGVRVSNAFGAANSGLAVTGNQMVSRLNGIQVSTQTSGTFSGNTIAGSTEAGIQVDADNAGLTFTRNVVAGSGVTDCRDLSTGAANTWTSNVAVRSTPRGICGYF